jgi:DnaJ-class molecular chaperone
MDDSFYSILEVGENASPEEIKKSYRRLSMKHHPDKNKNDPESTNKFQKISEAYDTLSDADKKRNYDMGRKNPFFNMMNGVNGNNAGPFGNHPMDDIINSLFGMQFGPGGPPGMGFNSGGPFGGPQIRVFHNGMPVNMNGLGGPQKPPPIIKTVSVPIDKILIGTTLPVEIERWIMNNEIKVFEAETIYVTVPKGIDDGEIIVLRDRGNVVNENCRGDIKLFIKIENNTEFKRNGLDLLLEKQITVKEALCGFSFELKYITGKTYTITNNSGNIISHGYQKVIPNMGFSREQHTGNLVISFIVLFPEKISDDVLAQLKQLDF